MAKHTKFFEDVMKVTGSAMHTVLDTAQGTKKHVEDSITHRVDDMLKKRDLVTREEYDVLYDMVQKLKKEIVQLKKDKK